MYIYILMSICFPQCTSYTATCLPSRKLYKFDEPDIHDPAGEAGTSS